MYNLYTLKAVRKDLRKIIKPAIHKITHFCFPKIAKNPYKQGISLHGNLRNYWKYIFKYKGKEYRIVYSISDKTKEVLVVLVGPREGLYERLLRRLR